MTPKIIMSCFFCLLFSQTVPNLICNGDLENYYLPPNAIHSMIPSNLNCWYNSDPSLVFEVKKIPRASTTKGIQLSSNQKDTICQTVTLKKFFYYSLAYSLYCDSKMWNMTLYVLINNIEISTLYVANTQSFGNGQVIFQATEIENQICFNQTHTTEPGYPWGYGIGGILDNITLQEISSSNISSHLTNSSINETSNIISEINNNVTNNDTINQNKEENQTNKPNSTNINVVNETSNFQNSIQSNYSRSEDIPGVNHEDISNLPGTNHEDISNLPGTNHEDISNLPETFDSTVVIEIHFQTIPKQLEWEIELVADKQYDPDMKESLEKTLGVFIEGQEQREFEITKNENGKLVIIIQAYRSYDISTIEAISQGQQNHNSPIQFIITIDGKPIYFNLLSEREKELIQAVSPIAEIMPSIVFKIHEIISSSLASFFILSLFNFWNLSLMYNFLLLKTFPNFSRNIYQVMLNLLYERGSFGEWIIKIFNISETAFEVEAQKGSGEKMPEFVDGFAWFRKLGFSSNPLVNNFDFLLIYGLLILKIVVLKLLLMLLSEKRKKSLGVDERFTKIIIAQTISFTPFIMISAFTSVVNGSLKFSQKIQVFVQIMLLFLCLSLLPLLIYENYIWLSPAKKALRHYAKMSRFNKMAYSKSELKKKIKAKEQEMFIEISQLVLVFTIPGTIWLNSPKGFLFFNTLVLAFSVVNLLRFIKVLNTLEKIKSVIMKIVWVIHHLIFVGFLIIEETRMIEKYGPEFETEILVILGIGAFMTVFIGGSLQLVKFFIDFVLLIVRIIKTIINICKQKKVQVKTKKDIQKSKEKDYCLPIEINSQNIKDHIQQIQTKGCVFIPVEHAQVQKCELNAENQKTRISIVK